MRIVLSRKGLDSSFGNTASAILPDGRLCFIPIPENSPKSPLLPSYNDIPFDGVALGQYVEGLSQGRLMGTQKAHLDPDLNPLHRPRASDWRPAFGQTGSAETHLRNQQVGKGDLFLFYGWFRETTFVDGVLRFVPKAPDMHVIFGWLHIEDRISAPAAQAQYPFLVGHPHCLPLPYAANDSVYISSRQLDLPGEDVGWCPGGGYFKKIDPRLVLTARGASRSTWRLPGWFAPNGVRPLLSYHDKLSRWRPDGDDVLLEAAGRGQEFVLDSADYPEAMSWVAEIIRNVNAS